MPRHLRAGCAISQSNPFSLRLAGPVAELPGHPSLLSCNGSIARAQPTGQRILGAPRSEASRTYDAAGRPSIKQVALCSARVPLGATHLYDMNKPSDIAAYAALVTTGIVWGGSVVAQKYSLGSFSAVEVSVIRGLGALAILVPLWWWQEGGTVKLMGATSRSSPRSGSACWATICLRCSGC